MKQKVQFFYDGHRLSQLLKVSKKKKLCRNDSQLKRYHMVANMPLKMLEYIL